MKILERTIVLEFDRNLDPLSTADLSNYEIRTWQLLRSKKYGSERLDQKVLQVKQAKSDGKTLRLTMDGLEKVDVFTIDYKIKNATGESLSGSIQGTIHELGK
jgi:hypothetical protein